MKVNFNKQTLYTLIIGMCVGAVTIMATLVLTGGVPWLRAAGVGSGAPDVNARYLDGYGTAVTTSVADKVLVTDGSAYLPDNSVDSGAIVNQTIVAADIAVDTITASQIAINAVGTEEVLDGSLGMVDFAPGILLFKNLSYVTNFNNSPSPIYLANCSASCPTNKILLAYGKINGNNGSLGTCAAQPLSIVYNGGSFATSVTTNYSTGNSTMYACCSLNIACIDDYRIF